MNTTSPTNIAPLGEYGENYYCKRDDFLRYIADNVNPARLAAGLKELDETTANECFRILNDFARLAHSEGRPPHHS